MKKKAARASSSRATSAPKVQPQPSVTVRACHGLSEFAACIEIERAVWGSADIDVVPLPLFVIAAETGGQVLGAFDGDRMIGFALAFAGVHERRPFLHSHMAAVLEDYRDAGVGRALKVYQREEALKQGIEEIEWTYDPLEVRNAYFNFRLGAIARRYLPNFYGVTTSPLHAGLPTDRLVAEWWLNSPRVRRGVGSRGETAKPSASRRKQLARIQVPPNIAALKRTQLEEAARLQAEIRQEFEHWFGLGYAATSIEIEDAGGTYVLEPWRQGE
jgi:predicted GNAT superfamily acetyltransferase